MYGSLRLSTDKSLKAVQSNDHAFNAQILGNTILIVIITFGAVLSILLPQLLESRKIRQDFATIFQAILLSNEIPSNPESLRIESVLFKAGTACLAMTAYCLALLVFMGFGAVVVGLVKLVKYLGFAMFWLVCKILPVLIKLAVPLAVATVVDKLVLDGALSRMVRSNGLGLILG